MKSKPSGLESRGRRRNQPVMVRAYKRFRDGRPEVVRPHVRRAHAQLAFIFEREDTKEDDSGSDQA